MLKVIKPESKDFIRYRDKLFGIYYKTFSEGISAQYLDKFKTQAYLDALFDTGFGIIAISDKHLAGVVLCSPPDFDNEMPEKLRENFCNDKTLYIAEVLVHSDHRSKGIAGKMLQVLEHQTKTNYDNLLLRVWDENYPALNFYKKNGFQTCGNITQNKFKPDGKTPLKMNKIYMQKRITQ